MLSINLFIIASFVGIHFVNFISDFLATNNQPLRQSPEPAAAFIGIFLKLNINRHGFIKFDFFVLCLEVLVNVVKELFLLLIGLQISEREIPNFFIAVQRTHRNLCRAWLHRVDHQSLETLLLLQNQASTHNEASLR